MRLRIQKLVADSGVCSRRHAESLINEGRITVNGIPAHVGDSADPEADSIELDGQPLFPQEKVYFVLNKPPGYECTMESTTGKPLATDLIETRMRIFPVGRLDVESRGLLILTNDGYFSNSIIHPSSSVEKEYLAKIEGGISESSLENLRRGVMLDRSLTRPCLAEVAGFSGTTTTLRFVIHEGRKRQIRRMLEAVGHSVVDLKRIRIGCLALDGLREGEYRELPEAEKNRLLEIARYGKIA